MADIRSGTDQKIKKKVVAKKPSKATPAKKAKEAEVVEGAKGGMKKDDSGGDSTEEDYSNHDFTNLIEQVQSEYQQAWWFIKPKWDEWALRIKLYNNQKRDKDAVGDNTLFTFSRFSFINFVIGSCISQCVALPCPVVLAFASIPSR